jgi:hypothetical protein
VVDTQSDGSGAPSAAARVAEAAQIERIRTSSLTHAAGISGVGWSLVLHAHGDFGWFLDRVDGRRRSVGLVADRPGCGLGWEWLDSVEVVLVGVYGAGEVLDLMDAAGERVECGSVGDS